MEHSLLLHNIRSAHNVGSIFRTADAAGISRMYLSGYTPTPLDGYGRPRKEVAKTALGAEQSIPWEYKKTPAMFLRAYKRSGGVVIGVEQDARAKDYRSFRLEKPTLILFGNEVRGLSPALRALCDELVEIPMRGAMLRQAHHPRHTGRGKESLNVSVAAGIVLFQLLQ